MSFHRIFYKIEKLPFLFICHSNIVAKSQMVQIFPQTVPNKSHMNLPSQVKYWLHITMNNLRTFFGMGTAFQQE